MPHEVVSVEMMALVSPTQATDEADPWTGQVKLAFLTLTAWSGTGAPWPPQSPVRVLTPLNLCVIRHTTPGQDCPLHSLRRRVICPLPA